jgi:hypothetical protein
MFSAAEIVATLSDPNFSSHNLPKAGSNPLALKYRKLSFAFNLDFLIVTQSNIPGPKYTLDSLKVRLSGSP